MTVTMTDVFDVTMTPEEHDVAADAREQARKAWKAARLTASEARGLRLEEAMTGKFDRTNAQDVARTMANRVVRKQLASALEARGCERAEQGPGGLYRAEWETAKRSFKARHAHLGYAQDTASITRAVEEAANAALQAHGWEI